MSLTHKSFGEDDAKQLWNKIANHMSQLNRALVNRALGRNVGREDVSHKVAWAAVKQKYKKDAEKWVKK